jgi:hypothetical protein
MLLTAGLQNEKKNLKEEIDFNTTLSVTDRASNEIRRKGKELNNTSVQLELFDIFISVSISISIYLLLLSNTCIIHIFFCNLLLAFYFLNNIFCLCIFKHHFSVTLLSTFCLRNLLYLRKWDFFLKIFSRIFIVLVFVFMSTIYFQLNFLYGVR